ncbi:MAG: hypothetical protein K2W33_01230, partial [Burkholderiales bacterium]|nr:hypothetical protein [Burkholderiales bacterium]
CESLLQGGTAKRRVLQPLCLPVVQADMAGQLARLSLQFVSQKSGLSLNWFHLFAIELIK